MRRRMLMAWLGVAALAFLACAARDAAARPGYFDVLTSTYGFAPGDDLYACGVCHRKWEGTGARNAFGTAVEQQLYLGKTIIAALMTVEPEDSDGDGFSNVDELTVYGTLPGYSCANYSDVIDPPPNFQSLITPGVPTCLLPKDLLIAPTTAAFAVEVGGTNTIGVQLVNNGTTDPITVTSYGLLAGADPSFGTSGPVTPLMIAVGSSATIDVTFAPTSTGVLLATLRIVSDDPDQPTTDIAVSGLSFVAPTAPADERAACQRSVEHGLEKFAKTHLREWGRCFLDELHGVACDAARRDQAIAKGDTKLRATIGGGADRVCAPNGLTPLLLGLPATCGAPCDAITLDSLSHLADCLVCRQQAATRAVLLATTATAPPDLPGIVLGATPHRCNLQVETATEKALLRTQKLLGRCALANVTAPTPADCPTTLASELAAEAAKVDGRLDRCADTTGMLGCRFEPMADPACLSATAQGAAAALVDAVFGASTP